MRLAREYRWRWRQGRGRAAVLPHHNKSVAIMRKTARRGLISRGTGASGGSVSLKFSIMPVSEQSP